MSVRSLRTAKARRAVVDDVTSPRTASADPNAELGWKPFLCQGVAAVVISGLGLATAGGVALTASAQATETGAAASATGTGHPDQSRAVPAPLLPRTALQGDQATQRDERDSAAIIRASEIFGRQGQQADTRNAVRAEIDRVVADQTARDRSAALSITSDQASDAANLAARDARATNLTDQSAAQKREEARLSEEKRKAEEALRQSQQQGVLGPGSNQAAQSSAGSGVSGSAASPVAPGQYSLGARWGAVGSWSRYHTGQDFPAPIGTPIRAAADGVVVASNGGGWAGTHAVIRHADGSATLYAHMSTIAVHPGQTVKAGDPVGAVGMTGRTFGPHLHFEHYPNASTVGNPYSTDDPYAWLQRLGVRL